LQRKKYTFAVVKFTSDAEDEETVEAVPYSWLTPAKSHCQWPSFTQPGKVQKAISSQMLPTPDWVKYSIKCLKKCRKCAHEFTAL